MVKNLYQNYCPAGTFRVAWNGANELGRSVSTGIYFCELATPSGKKSIKMQLII